ncbi:hypothetical protein P3T76_015956 [Phytophthora citrophthora]|uniref:Uncharacterized protein n=1 Tax=Phytophthora citrophthora TaxID=4793 RepID=A0AAD9FYF2_9STRA|nr:hypothetical protein P3T76_015956 [Phytophthora citrophthora]
MQTNPFVGLRIRDDSATVGDVLSSLEFLCGFLVWFCRALLLTRIHSLDFGYVTILRYVVWCVRGMRYATVGDVLSSLEFLCGFLVWFCRALLLTRIHSLDFGYVTILRYVVWCVRGMRYATVGDVLSSLEFLCGFLVWFCRALLLTRALHDTVDCRHLRMALRVSMDASDLRWSNPFVGLRIRDDSATVGDVLSSLEFLCGFLVWFCRALLLTRIHSLDFGYVTILRYVVWCVRGMRYATVGDVLSSLEFLCGFLVWFCRALLLTRALHDTVDCRHLRMALRVSMDASDLRWSNPFVGLRIRDDSATVGDVLSSLEFLCGFLVWFCRALLLTRALHDTVDCRHLRMALRVSMDASDLRWSNPFVGLRIRDDSATVGDVLSSLEFLCGFLVWFCRALLLTRALHDTVDCRHLRMALRVSMDASDLRWSNPFVGLRIRDDSATVGDVLSSLEFLCGFLVWFCRALLLTRALHDTVDCRHLRMALRVSMDASDLRWSNPFVGLRIRDDSATVGDVLSSLEFLCGFLVWFCRALLLTRALHDTVDCRHLRMALRVSMDASDLRWSNPFVGLRIRDDSATVGDVLSSLEFLCGFLVWFCRALLLTRIHSLDFGYVTILRYVVWCVRGMRYATVGDVLSSLEFLCGFLVWFCRALLLTRALHDTVDCRHLRMALRVSMDASDLRWSNPFVGLRIRDDSATVGDVLSSLEFLCGFLVWFCRALLLTRALHDTVDCRHLRMALRVSMDASDLRWSNPFVGLRIRDDSATVGDVLSSLEFLCGFLVWFCRALLLTRALHDTVDCRHLRMALRVSMDASDLRWSNPFVGLRIRDDSATVGDVLSSLEFLCGFLVWFCRALLLTRALHDTVDCRHLRMALRVSMDASDLRWSNPFVGLRIRDDSATVGDVLSSLEFLCGFLVWFCRALLLTRALHDTVDCRHLRMALRVSMDASDLRWSNPFVGLRIRDDSATVGDVLSSLEFLCGFLVWFCRALLLTRALHDTVDCRHLRMALRVSMDASDLRWSNPFVGLRIRDDSATVGDVLSSLEFLCGFLVWFCRALLLTRALHDTVDCRHLRMALRVSMDASDLRWSNPFVGLRIRDDSATVGDVLSSLEFLCGFLVWFCRALLLTRIHSLDFGYVTILRYVVWCVRGMRYATVGDVLSSLEFLCGFLVWFCRALLLTRALHDTVDCRHLRMALRVSMDASDLRWSNPFVGLRIRDDSATVGDVLSSLEFLCGFLVWFCRALLLTRIHSLDFGYVTILRIHSLDFGYVTILRYVVWCVRGMRYATVGDVLSSLEFLCGFLVWFCRALLLTRIHSLDFGYVTILRYVVWCVRGMRYATVGDVLSSLEFLCGFLVWFCRALLLTRIHSLDFGYVTILRYVVWCVRGMRYATVGDVLSSLEFLCGFLVWFCRALLLTRIHSLDFGYVTILRYVVWCVRGMRYATVGDVLSSLEFLCGFLVWFCRALLLTRIHSLDFGYVTILRYVVWCVRGMRYATVGDVLSSLEFLCGFLVWFCRALLLTRIHSLDFGYVTILRIHSLDFGYVTILRYVVWCVRGMRYATVGDVLSSLEFLCGFLVWFCRALLLTRIHSLDFGYVTILRYVVWCVRGMRYATVGDVLSSLEFLCGFLVWFCRALLLTRIHSLDFGYVTILRYVVWCVRGMRYATVGDVLSSLEFLCGFLVWFCRALLLTRIHSLDFGYVTILRYVVWCVRGMRYATVGDVLSSLEFLCGFLVWFCRALLLTRALHDTVDGRHLRMALRVSMDASDLRWSNPFVGLRIRDDSATVGDVLSSLEFLCGFLVWFCRALLLTRIHSLDFGYVTILRYVVWCVRGMRYATVGDVLSSLEFLCGFLVWFCRALLLTRIHSLDFGYVTILRYVVWCVRGMRYATVGDVLSSLEFLCGFLVWFCRALLLTRIHSLDFGYVTILRYVVWCVRGMRYATVGDVLSSLEFLCGFLVWFCRALLLTRIHSLDFGYVTILRYVVWCVRGMRYATVGDVLSSLEFLCGFLVWFCRALLLTRIHSLDFGYVTILRYVVWCVRGMRYATVGDVLSSLEFLCGFLVWFCRALLLTRIHSLDFGYVTILRYVVWCVRGMRYATVGDVLSSLEFLCGFLVWFCRALLLTRIHSLDFGYVTILRYVVWCVRGMRYATVGDVLSSLEFLCGFLVWFCRALLLTRIHSLDFGYVTILRYVVWCVRGMRYATVGDVLSSLEFLCGFLVWFCRALLLTRIHSLDFGYVTILRYVVWCVRGMRYATVGDVLSSLEFLCGFLVWFCRALLLTRIHSLDFGYVTILRYVVWCVRGMRYATVGDVLSSLEFLCGFLVWFCRALLLTRIHSLDFGYVTILRYVVWCVRGMRYAVCV